jgi:predicted nucleotidyltransferase
MDPTQDAVVQMFSRETKRRIDKRLRGNSLFGSRARGDARQTSYYDMLVIVNEKTLEVRADLLDIEVEILDRYEALVASLLRTRHEWERSNASPLARNSEREGIKL